MIRVPRMPDVTAAQRLALAQLVVGLAIAFGVPLDATKQAELVGDVSGAFALLVIVDGWIRHSRAKHVAPELVRAIASPAVRAQRPTSPSTIAAAVADAGRTFADAELANGPPPEPGTYPVDEPPESARDAVDVDTAAPLPAAADDDATVPGD